MEWAFILLKSDKRQPGGRALAVYLCARKMLRIWQGNQVRSVVSNYYDQFIINNAKKLQSKQMKDDYIKSARLIGEVIGHLNQYIGDRFIPH
jgi:hypothetical protein